MLLRASRFKIDDTCSSLLSVASGHTELGSRTPGRNFHGAWGVSPRGDSPMLALHSSDFIFLLTRQKVLYIPCDQSRGEATARVSAEVAWHEAQPGLPRGASPIDWELVLQYCSFRPALCLFKIQVPVMGRGHCTRIAFLDNASSSLLQGFALLGNMCKQCART